MEALRPLPSFLILFLSNLLSTLSGKDFFLQTLPSCLLTKLTRALDLKYFP
jgi:hypothetical protein